MRGAVTIWITGSAMSPLTGREAWLSGNSVRHLAFAFKAKRRRRMSDDTNDTSLDIHSELAKLREQVKALMNERVSAALSQAADTARQYAGETRKIYGEQAEALSEQVRQSPGMAVLVAATIGYVLGRITR